MMESPKPVECIRNSYPRTFLKEYSKKTPQTSSIPAITPLKTSTIQPKKWPNNTKRSWMLQLLPTPIRSSSWSRAGLPISSRKSQEKPKCIHWKPGILNRQMLRVLLKNLVIPAHFPARNNVGKPSKRPLMARRRERLMLKMRMKKLIIMRGIQRKMNLSKNFKMNMKDKIQFRMKGNVDQELKITRNLWKQCKRRISKQQEMLINVRWKMDIIKEDWEIM